MFKFILKQKNINKQKGFSLIEMLVAIAVFMSIMTIAISALVTIISANKKAQAIKSTVDSVTFAMEKISRDMRVGHDYECLKDGNYTNICSPEGSNSVQYKTSDDTSVSYTFSKNANGQAIITEKRGGASTDLISGESGVIINNMKFYVFGADTENAASQIEKTQPRVIITISGAISVKGSEDTAFDLQTTVSQRSRQ